MKKPTPVGFAALLEKMPRTFRKQANAIEKRARQRRERQAARFMQAFQQAPAQPTQQPLNQDNDAWQDTVAGFSGRNG